jgi:uncharacterized protein DUF6883
VRDKLARYSLDLEHRDGGPKAVLFRAALGITAADVDYLAESLLAGIRVTPIRAIRENPPFGYHCEVRIGVRGLRARSDRTLPVLTSWQVVHEGAPPRLVTAYIKG